MTGGPTPDELTRLPGSARFISRVAADLAAGRSVIVVFPDALVDSGVADAVLEDLEREGVSTAFCDRSAKPFPERILTTFGADPRHESDSAEWDTIIGWEPWHGSWIFVPGWQHEDIDEVVDRWPAQLNACGLSVDDRPKLIIGVRLTDLSRTKIIHVDRNSVAVHWWWGVLDRLDTELRLAASNRTLNPIDAAVIVEVSGWDLECTDFLAAEWDRTTSGLCDALRCYRTQAADDCHVPVVTGMRRGHTAPPAELEQSWRDGLVDRWGHGIRRAVHVTDQADVTQRLWMAHNRVLIQYVDEERADYEQMILAKAPRAALDDLRHREDDDIIEIGSLAWLVSSRRIDIGKAHRERLLAFRDLRNDLAHRRPIGDELLRRIAAYLEF